MRRIGLIAALIVAFGFTGTLSAASINVLWYTGGVVDNFTQAGLPNDYKAAMGVLAGQAATTPAIAVNNTWNLTFWDAGPIPAGSFDVLVVVSPQGGWNSYPSYAPLLAAAPTLGNRKMVSGQDADWHYLNGVPSYTTFNGPQGFLIDSINWAGSGTGMGYVSLGGNPFTFAGLGAKQTFHTNTVNIPAAYASFPINEGLTSSGLSNWSSSAHTQWVGWDPLLWTGININQNSKAVTLVSADQASGSTHGVPEPGTMIVWSLLGLIGICVYRRRRTG